MLDTSNTTDPTITTPAPTPEATNTTKDWFVVNTSLPNPNQQELEANNITTENTVLKDRDFYKSSPKVQAMFVDTKNGKFNEDSFNQYYDGLVVSYNDFATGAFVKNAEKNFEYLPWGQTPKDGKIATNLYKSEKIANPFGVKRGAAGMGVESGPDLSYREIAQNNYVYDGVTGERLNWKPNDDDARGILKFWKKSRVAIARYDEDGVSYDPQSGTQKEHKKGDFKLGEYGEIHYETLGDKEPYGKEVLGWSDTLTKDGTWQDDYNFLASDGMTKSIAGTIAKAAVKMAPLYLRGTAGDMYAYALIGTELMEVLPMLAKAGVGLFVNDAEVNKDYWKGLSKIQQLGAAMSTSSVSDVGNASFFSAEQMVGLIGGTFSFLKEMNALAKIPQYLGVAAKSGEGKMALFLIENQMGPTLAQKAASGGLTVFEKNAILEAVPEAANFINNTLNATKMAKALSTTYLATTMAASITEQAKELGLDERDTAALYLGASAALFGQMRYMPIGHWAMENVGLDQMAASMRKSFGDKSKLLTDEMIRIKAIPAGNAGRYKSLYKIGGNLANTFRNAITGGSVNEGTVGAQYGMSFMSQGLEMMAIEGIKDGLHTVYNGMVGLNMVSSDEGKKFAPEAPEDVLTRYASTFFSGAVGGLLFKLNDNMNSAKNTMPTQDIAWYVRNGFSDKIYNLIGRQEKEGFASKVLSTRRVSVQPGKGVDPVIAYEPAKEYKDSQNFMIAESLRQYIKNLENQIFQFGGIKDVALSKTLDNATELIVDLKVNSPMFSDYNKICSNIIEIDAKINEASKVSMDAPDSAVGAAAIQVQTLQAERAVEVQKLANIGNGKAFPEYQRKALFMLNSGKDERGDYLSLNEPFANISIGAFTKHALKKDYSELTTAEKVKIDEEYDAFRKFEAPTRLLKAYDFFTEMLEKTSPHLLDLKNEIEATKEQRKLIDYQFDLEGLTKEEVANLEPVKAILNDLFDHIDAKYHGVYKYGEKGIVPVLKTIDKLRLIDHVKEITKSKAINSEVADKLIGFLDSITISEHAGLLDTYWKINHDRAADITEETGTETFAESFNFNSLAESFANKGLKRPGDQLHNDLKSTNVTEIPSILQKYRDLIQHSNATDEIKAEDFKALDEVTKRVYEHTLYEPHTEDLQTHLGATNETLAHQLEHAKELGKLPDTPSNNRLKLEIKQQIERLQNTRESLQERLDQLNKFRGEKAYTLGDLINTTTKLKEVIDSKRTSVLSTFLKRFEMMHYGKTTNIIELLTSEFENLAIQSSILDYQINDPQIFQKLEYATNIVSQLKSILAASTDYITEEGLTFGYNNTINKTFPGLKLETLDQDSSMDLIGRLSTMERKLKFLTNLAQLNNADKLRNNKESQINIEALQFSTLANDAPLRMYLDDVKINGEQFITPDIINAIDEATIFDRYLASKKDKEAQFKMPETVDELLELERQALKVHSAIYNRMQELIDKEPTGITRAEKELAVQNQLLGIDASGEMSPEAKKVFPPLDLTQPLATSYTATETTIQPAESLMWLNVHMMLNPEDFINALKGKLQPDNSYSGLESSQYVPFYSQEYSFRVMKAVKENRAWFNRIIKAMSGKDSYLSSIMSPFEYSIFIDAGTGVGKSTAICSPMARDIRERGEDFWVAAPKDKQVRNLERGLGLDRSENKSFNKREFLAALFSEDPSLIAEFQDTKNLVATTDTITTPAGALKEKDKQEEGVDKSTFTYHVLKDEIVNKIKEFGKKSKKTLPSTIFIDECTFFSGAELKAIQTYINNKENSPFIVLMGDSKQNGEKIQGENHNINLFNVLRSPKLEISLRESNTLKKRNLDKINTLYTDIIKKYRIKHITVETTPYSILTNEIAAITKANPLQLSYHIDEAGKVFGEQIINPKEIDIEYVKKLASNTKDLLGFITDDPLSDLVKTIQADPELSKKVEILPEDTVQGSEYENVLIDIDWTKYSATSATLSGTDLEWKQNMAPLNMISALYTLSSRSEGGTIILDNGLSKYETFHIENIKEKGYFPTRLDPALVKKYKENRIEVINALTADFNTPTTNETSVEKKETKTKTESVLSGAELEKVTDSEAIIIKGLLESQTPYKIQNDHTDSTSLLGYSFYRRGAHEGEEALPNEDMGYLSKVMKNKSIEDLIDMQYSIKNHMMLGEGIKSLRRIMPTDDLQFEQAKFIVRGSRYNTKRDASVLSPSEIAAGKERQGEKKGKILNDGDAFLRLAVEIPRKDKDSVYITLAVFGHPDSIRGDQDNLRTELERLTKEVYNKIPEETDFKTAINFEVSDPKFADHLVPFNAIQMIDIDTPIELETFKANLRGASFVSDPYILTGQSPISVKQVGGTLDVAFKKWTSEKKLSGESIIFVSYDPKITNNEAAKNRFADERLAAQEAKDPRELPAPTVRMIVLNPVPLEPMEWLVQGLELVKSYNAADKAKKMKNPVGSIASPMIAARIYRTFLKVYNDTNGASKGSPEAEINDFCGKVLDRVNLAFGFDPKTAEPLARYLEKDQDAVMTSFGNKDPLMEKVQDDQYGVANRFFNNQKYKLLVALEFSIFGTEGGKRIRPTGANLTKIELNIDSVEGARIEEKELAFSPLLDADFRQEKVWQNFEVLFNEKFKAAWGPGEKGFPQGIFTHPIYNRSAEGSGQKTESRMEFAIPASGSFKVSRIPTSPDILIDLKNVVSADTLKKLVQERLAEGTKELQDAFEGLVMTLAPEIREKFAKDFEKNKRIIGENMDQAEKNIKFAKEKLEKIFKKYNTAPPLKSDEILYTEKFNNTIESQLNGETIKSQNINFDNVNKMLNFTVETNEGNIIKGKMNLSLGEAEFKIEPSPAGKKDIALEELGLARTETSEAAIKAFDDIATSRSATKLEPVVNRLRDSLSNIDFKGEILVREDIRKIMESPEGKLLDSVLIAGSTSKESFKKFHELLAKYFRREC